MLRGYEAIASPMLRENVECPKKACAIILRIRPFAAPLARSNSLRVQLFHVYLDRALESNYKINREIARVI